MLHLEDDQYFPVLLDKIQQDHGVFLHDYRKACLGRRVLSRLHATKIDSLQSYIDILDGNPEEYRKLMDAVTINVTEFFRNPRVFLALQKKVIPELLERKKRENNRVIRVWSAGCSSGEEVYTLAILFSEYMRLNKEHFFVKIIGSDLDKKVLQKAILGDYQPHVLKGVTPPLLKNYFVPTDNGYAIADKLRLMTKFLHHDLVADKPLSNIDLILCRNVVIYFSRDLSYEVYAGFYQALKPKGYLVLGSIEALWGEVNKYFESIDIGNRIYQKMV